MAEHKDLDKDLQDILNAGNGTNFAQNINITNASLWIVQELRNLQKSTEKQILAQEETKKALNNLTSTIKELDRKNGVLQKGIFWFTLALFALGVIQIFVVLFPHI